MDVLDRPEELKSFGENISKMKTAGDRYTTIQAQQPDE